MRFKHLQRPLGTLLFLALNGAFSRPATANEEGHHKPEKKLHDPGSAHAGKSDESKKASEPSSKAAKKFVNKVACEALPQKTDKDLWGTAECFFKIGLNAKAVEILREATRRNPKDLDAYFTSAWLLWSDGHLLSGEEEKKKNLEAADELQRARLSNPTHWEVDTEMGDFYLLRMNLAPRAYAEYIKAREHYDGDYSRSVPKAENGRKAAIEDRIARLAENLDNKGEAVEASCRALFFDPDDKAAENRIEKLGGSCVRKKVKNPKLSTKSEQHPPSSSLEKP